MLDLVAEVAGEDMEQATTLQVAGAAQLAQVPVPAALPLHRLLAEHRRALGEVAAEDHQEGPQVAQQVGQHVARQHRQGVGPQQQRQQGEQGVVLEPLACDLEAELAQQRAHLGAADAALVPLVQAQVLDRHGVLEQQRLQRDPQRLPAVEGLPALLGEQAHHAIADVVIHADHIGPGVMGMVVRVPPEVGRADDVPLVAPPGQLRIVHPVVLAVHHVVAQLHVLEDLAQAQQQAAKQPGRREPAEHQQRAAAPAAQAHRAAHPADVAGIALAQRGEGLAAQFIQLGGEGVEFHGGEFTVKSHRRCPRDRVAHRPAAR